MTYRKRLIGNLSATHFTKRSRILIQGRDIMKYHSLAITLVVLSLSGCSTFTTPINMNNQELAALNLSSGGFHTDLGKSIEYSSQEGLYRIRVYVGGEAGCYKHVIGYALPKIDRFMEENGFSSYDIVKSVSDPFPLKICDLYIDFKT